MPWKVPALHLGQFGGARLTSDRMIFHDFSATSKEASEGKDQVRLWLLTLQTGRDKPLHSFIQGTYPVIIHSNSNHLAGSWGVPEGSLISGERRNLILMSLFQDGVPGAEKVFDSATCPSTSKAQHNITSLAHI
ncbi:uncharacterized protein GJ701_003901 isoform 1-T1 [Geothlypis trichas]